MVPFLKYLLSEIPPLEATVFMCLVLITIFRRRLSSNDEYRAEEPALMKGGGSSAALTRIKSDLEARRVRIIRALRGDYDAINLQEDDEMEEEDAEQDQLEDLPTISRLTSQLDSMRETASLHTSTLRAVIMRKIHGMGTIDMKTWFRLSRRRLHHLHQRDLTRTQEQAQTRAEESQNRSRASSKDSVHSASSTPIKKKPLVRYRPNKSLLEETNVELLAQILAFLPHDDICRVSECSHALYDSCRDDFVWKSLWLQNFGDMWANEKVREIRRQGGSSLRWDPTTARSPRGGAESERGDDHHRGNPAQGWFLFYLEFDACWQDWLLANHATQESCVLGIGGNLYDITSFVPVHPGSPEALLEMCGGDATESFVDVGHSQHAIKLSKKMLVYSFQDAHKARACGPQLGLDKELSSFNLNGHQRKRLTRFRQLLRQERRVVERGAARKNLLNYSATNVSSPSVESALDCGGGAVGCPHLGRPRAVFDPWLQQWNVWWTCCAHTQPVHAEKTEGWLLSGEWELRGIGSKMKMNAVQSRSTATAS